MDPVLVTGATGFVGSALVRQLAQRGTIVRAAVRSMRADFPPGVSATCIGDLDGDTDWHAALAGVRTVFHCAARAHILKEDAEDPAAAYRRVNTLGTLNLARHAIEAGVRRFVFLSTIGVLGSATSERPYRADDPPAPDSPYAVSKLEAEQGLQALAQASPMQIVIVRPPLVYGPGAPGNIARMLRWLRKGVPLPLAAVANRRSLVGIDNLVDFLIRCSEHPAAANRVFLVRDAEDVSTPSLLRRVGEAAGLDVRLFSVPSALLTFAAKAVGKAELAQRLCGSLQIDASESCRLLDWVPPLSVDAGLRRMGEHYQSEAHS